MIKDYICHGFPATQAAIRAGYSRRTAREIGRENLTEPDIRQMIEAAEQKSAERIELTREHVAERLRKVLVPYPDVTGSGGGH